MVSACLRQHSRRTVRLLSLLRSAGLAIAALATASEPVGAQQPEQSRWEISGAVGFSRSLQHTAPPGGLWGHVALHRPWGRDRWLGLYFQHFNLGDDDDLTVATAILPGQPDLYVTTRRSQDGWQLGLEITAPLSQASGLTIEGDVGYQQVHILNLVTARDSTGAVISTVGGRSTARGIGASLGVRVDLLRVTQSGVLGLETRWQPAGLWDADGLSFLNFVTAGLALRFH